MKKNENGFCKSCGLDFDSGDILQTFLDQGKTPGEAKEIAEMYGYGPGRTQWEKQIGITDLCLDRTVDEICPECNSSQWK